MDKMKHLVEVLSIIAAPLGLYDSRTKNLVTKRENWFYDLPRCEFMEHIDPTTCDLEKEAFARAFDEFEGELLKSVFPE